MAHMGFCNKHNMVAFLQKPTESEEFQQIVDFLAGSHIRVKKLEYKMKSGKERRKEKIVLSDDKEIAEDSFKQGRKIS
ncbi:hypothetical protein Tco_1035073 [Tanacetum coccineum]